MRYFAGVIGLLRQARQQSRRARVAMLSGMGALALALALFIVSVVVLNLNLERVQENFAQVGRTDRVLLEIAAVETGLADAAAMARSYLLTGDAAYLQSFRASREAADGALAAVTQGAAGDPAQARRVDELRSLATARLATLARQVEAGDASLVRAAVQDDVSERSLVRGMLAGFKEAVATQLLAREDEVNRGAVLSTIAAALLGALALVSGGLGLFLLEREQSRAGLRELETELIHVSRLNTLGQTASMLAHEINQPLAATSNYLQGARRLLETGASADRVGDALRKAAGQIDRASEIVRRLRSYVRKREPEQSAADIAAIIGDAVALTGIERGGVLVHRRIDRDLPPALIDKVQAQQVLVNLLRNAAEAMAECDRREVTISAMAAGSDMAQISVADTGPGLPETVAERLFQPFLSTKADGMGVGLSICRTIVERQGGRIWAEPGPAGGAVFHFTIALMPQCIRCERRGSACPHLECPSL